MGIQELDNLAHKARATLLNIHNTVIDAGEPRILRAFLQAYNVGDMRSLAPLLNGWLAMRVSALDSMRVVAYI